ncbi:MAG: cardiolipin synthase [Verrucomicrobiales bacterium]
MLAGLRELFEVPWVQWVGFGLILCVHLAGLLAGVYVLMTGRTSQGVVGWILGLWLLPEISLILFIFFGPRKFYGYVTAHRRGKEALDRLTTKLARSLEAMGCASPPARGEFKALENLARLPFTAGNTLRLLIDGEAGFGAMFEAIREAKHYVLVQFYIVRDDALGRELKLLLLEKCREGVAVYFLYDPVGSYQLPRAYERGLRDGGVKVFSFNRIHFIKNRYKINFRNHRKIIVTDGDVAFVGGLNVGEEYLGRNAYFGRWRDTMVRVEGPAVMSIQHCFLEDWYWASGLIPEWNWTPRPGCAGAHVLTLPTGPADELETCGLTFIHAIHSAQKRIWITSPYFVPDGAVVAALQLAVMRGVDVRILIPEKVDHRLVYLASFAYLEETVGCGMKLYRYTAGFMHQKVILVDDAVAAVGTANLDNRSFRINFELFVVCLEQGFVAEVRQMLEHDFAESRLVSVDEFRSRSFAFRLLVRVVRLLAPVL